MHAAYIGSTANGSVMSAELDGHRLLQSLPAAMLLVAEARVVVANQAAATLWGVACSDDLVGRRLETMIPPEAAASVTARVPAKLPVETTICLAGSGRLQVEIDSTSVMNAERPATQLVVRDITRWRDAQRMTEHLAFHDALTGLANRARFTDALRRACRRARHEGEHLAVMLLDLDGFKAINDRLGHLVGDAVLVEVARRIEESTRWHEVVARLGGDEFAVLASDLTRPEDSAAIAARISDALARPISVGTSELICTASIGVSIPRQEHLTPEQLLAEADTALYAAKADGGGTWRLFDRSLQETARRRRTVAAELREAIENGRLELIFPPIFDATSLRPTALEVLPIWRDAPQGEIGAETLIATAGEHGLVNPLSRWLLEQLSGVAHSWAAAGLAGTPLVVAVPTELSRAATLVPLVARLLSGSGLPGCSLQLALNEAALIDEGSATRLLIRLDELGVSVAIDDFGLGPFPLLNLLRLPVRQIRLRRYWQQCLDEGPRGARMLRALAGLAHGLDLEVAALGVGSDAALDDLRRIGCDRIQGRRLSRPLGRETVATLLRDLRATQAA